MRQKAERLNQRTIWDANRGQGSNWIYRPTRLRIYDRDRWCCVWCGQKVATGPGIRDGQPGRLATLDHLVPRSEGGSNRPANLVTACLECNSERAGKELDDWLEELDGPSAAIRRRLPAA